MLVFDKKRDITNRLDLYKGRSTVGFVPTMGALHQGHISLVEEAKRKNDLVVVSIFVNPTQFNNPDDLKNYPRTIEVDKEKLIRVNTDILFFPAVDEMYPPGEPPSKEYNFGNLEKVMEGKHRPGHFKGVAQIVEKLLKIVNPDCAYFGEKDFQQLAIIRAMVKQLDLPVEIAGCPTERERDGLAMSSRNVLLSETERKEAQMISKALFFIRDNWRNYELDKIRQQAINIIEKNGLMKVEYLEIAESENLQPVSDWSSFPHIRCFTAVKIGKVRLIDNVPIITTPS